ncbi:MAG: hypothetical protein KJP18_07310 [Gemmatimonadetes bacterium]|nr:hypothetical protein [Gemmatimonadota bacterium]NNF37701.1 hypothetical protein [Gemmatimonadota bacterium]
MIEGRGERLRRVPILEDTMHGLTRWTALGMLLAAAACDTGAGPEAAEPFDARAVADDYAAITSILGSADWTGVRVVGRATQPAGAAAGSPGPAGAPLISDLNRGSTFVYDPESGDWVVDPDRDGAPENGVRFIIYEEVAGVPDPSRERGFADLIDEGDDSVEDIALRLRVTEAGAVTLDYAIRADETAGAGSLSTMGYVVGDGQRLDFDVRAEGEQGGTHTLTFDLAVDERDFAVGGEATGSETSDDGRVVVEASHRSHRLDLDVAAESGSLDGRIDVDGRGFVTVAGPSDDPVFTRADGSPLRPVEVLALLGIMDFVEDVFDLVEDVLDPVDNIVVLGFLL